MKKPPYPLRIGTRASQLALAQAEETRLRLLTAHPDLAEKGAVEIIPMTTTGDRVTDVKLAEIGGKGLFTKEIEEALLAGHVDIAVHSMKDMPTVLPNGLIIACLFEREDPSDALLLSPALAECRTIDELPQGALCGTSSLRRAAQLLMRRPDLRIAPFRGNVTTRLRKLEQQEVDATLLAIAGLKRLGLTEAARLPIATETMLPAVAQGAIGIECRTDDERMQALLAPLHHAPTGFAVTAERALLRALDGSCRTPIAALAKISGGHLHLRALIATPDGAIHHATERTGSTQEASMLGQDAGDELRLRGGADFFKSAP